MTTQNENNWVSILIRIPSRDIDDAVTDILQPYDQRDLETTDEGIYVDVRKNDVDTIIKLINEIEPELASMSD